MDETEDNEGKEAGANSSVCEESKETNSCTNSDQNDPNEEQLQENNAEEPEAEKQKEHESEHNEAGPSKCKDDKEDDSATIQPEDEANEEPALVDGKEGADTAADKEIENNENQSKKNDDEDDDEDNMEESKIEMVDESRTNDKPVDEGRENGETKEKDSEMEAPEEMEMKDVSDSECPDVLEDGEILEESQASTSQDVSVSQEDVSLEEPDTIEEAVEVKTFEEAKERIGVLEKRIEREVGHRTDLMKQVRSLRLELHKVKGGSDLETQTVGVQTDPECIQIYDEQPPTLQAEVYQVVESSGTAQQGPSAAAGATQWPTRTPAQASSSTQAQSVAESVRATAEAALAQSGVVLDEASGMYYDYNSGYYYDPNNHLYYDPARGMYYFYDEQTQSYQFHSKIDLPEVVVTGTKGSRSQSDRKRHERERQKGERSRKGRNPDQSREESETSDKPSTSRSRTANPDCEVIDITSPSEDSPENGMDATSATTTSATTSATTAKPQDQDRNQDGIDVVEIVDDDDPSKHHRHKRRLKYSHSRRKRRKTEDEEERKENGEEELPDVIVIDSDDSDMEEGELSDSSSESGGSSKGESGEDGEGEDVSEESMVIDDDDDVQSVEATKVDYPPCIRMIVVRSESMKLGSLSIVTCTGGTIGREGSNHILLVPELGVSKTHAQMLYDTERRCYTITDLGSQNGTVLNGVPLTRKSRVKSDPQPLSHKDYLTFGTTTLRIHIHRGDETCDECEPGQVQATFRHQQSTEVTPVLSHADKEQQRRKELRKIKKKYLLAGTGYSQREPSRSHPGYKDRAGERRVTVGSDNPYQPNDMPASVDRAISGSNMGHKMLKKMGWQEGQSLGKNESGIKEPIQVFVHSKKSGLGTGNQKSMDNLGLIGKRKSEHWERARDRYHHLDHGASGSASTSSSRQHTRPQEMKWVKGTTQVHEPPADSAPQKDDDGDVEVVSEVVAMEDGETTRKDAVNKDTVHNVCDVDMDHDDKKNGGGGDGKRAESSNGEGSSKNGVGVEIKAAGEIAEEVPSVSGDGSKTIPSSSNSVTISNDVTENQNNAEPESTSNSDLQNQVDGSNARQTRLESTNSKADPQGPSRMSNSLSSKDEQNSVEVPAEREAAKKPIRFVIPPRMNSKGDLGKTPLTASRSVSDSNGEGPSTRRTRQSSRRGKEKKDNIDMFDDG
ncbi:angiogenic factor with G patch and FHA domains 1 isoform X2 [Strongylocentrotus purpuratus]|uniref:Angiogenic factor with G patch and FHA domains 1 n=1 Tax=Strongylocentrotus purpuratus TaxID=7668 RepID=A0A7M7SUK7_STRPU|nr:angiogenic factor with G patch and FHA domains 1 isoform X2 [Strongylocentrotus purpuratus]